MVDAIFGIWRAIIRQRQAIANLLRRNRGFKSRLEEAMNESWDKARDLVIVETDLPENRFPLICPFSIEQVISEEV